ncbi:hybrid signal transduction histidine kinase M [Tanacetum coccineum]
MGQYMSSSSNANAGVAPEPPAAVPMTFTVRILNAKKKGKILLVLLNLFGRFGEGNRSFTPSADEMEIRIRGNFVPGSVENCLQKYANHVEIEHDHVEAADALRRAEALVHRANERLHKADAFRRQAIALRHSTDPEWSRLDDLVKVWILGTCSESLQDQVVTTPGTAKDLWYHLKDLFHDNEDARAITIDNQLRSITIGNLSINAYFSKIQSMADRLKNLGGTVKDTNLVIYALNGLDARYKHIAKIIRHQNPLPTFAETKNKLLLEESELADEHSKVTTHVDSTSSSPTILLAPNNNNGNRENASNNSAKGTGNQAST